jgi:hypothetical protein
MHKFHASKEKAAAAVNISRTVWLCITFMLPKKNFLIREWGGIRLSKHAAAISYSIERMHIRCKCTTCWKCENFNSEALDLTSTITIHLESCTWPPASLGKYADSDPPPLFMTLGTFGLTP